MVKYFIMKKPIVYLISKFEYHSPNYYNKETGLYEMKFEDRYHIYRRGKIFKKRLHIVGDWLCDSQGGTWCTQNDFTSIEQAKSYLKGWHIETYGKNRTYIIEDYEQKEK